LTFPVHAPLALWLIVLFFRRRRGAATLCEADEAGEAEAPALGSGEGCMEEARREAERVLAATQDANELARELMAEYRDAFGIHP